MSVRIAQLEPAIILIPDIENPGVSGGSSQDSGLHHEQHLFAVVHAREQSPTVHLVRSEFIEIPEEVVVRLRCSLSEDRFETLRSDFPFADKTVRKHTR